MLPDASRSARLRAALLLCLVALLGGCASVGYVAQAARGQLGVLRARQPIDRLLASPETPTALRARLEQVKQIREFASRELLLPDNASYRSYADIGRPYVVWNVVATPALSVTPREWCFPVAGCVAYRGYFSEAAARRFAAGLAARGDDVAVFGVAAYSTLGKFSDPVLNTMTAYGPLDLAGLIFHELAHQKLYVAGDSAFNEAFATTVEERGLARYAERHATPAALAAWHARRERGEGVNKVVAEARARLRTLYRSDSSAAEKLERRKGEFAALAAQVEEMERAGGYRTGLHDWLEGGLNNAHLAAFATYRERQPLFETLFDIANGDFAAFYRAADAAAATRRVELKGPPRRRVGPRP
ncbi:MAG: aminopeptidase [Steroidobacteraceae bacterium]